MKNTRKIEFIRLLLVLIERRQKEKQASELVRNYGSGGSPRNIHETLNLEISILVVAVSIP